MKLKLYTLFALVLLVGFAQSCNRKPEDKQQKMVVYQVFTRLFGSDCPHPVVGGTLEQNGTGRFEDFTSQGLDSIKAMGMTHIWYTGVVEHASIYSVDTVGGLQMNHPGVIKGKAGSPYAIKDYYDVNAYLANDPSQRMEEFEALVQRSHDAGLGVIIDFVPNHVARGYHSDSAPAGVEDFGANDDNTLAFAANNNFYYLPGKSLEPKFETAMPIAYKEFPAKVSGNDVFSAEPQIHDWYETVKLNYGVDYMNNRTTHFDPIPNTWLKMRDVLLFWASKDVDGFRCDMAEMVPKEFWAWVVKEVKAQYPDLTFIAEIYNPAAYEEYIKEGGFDFLYDKVGLYDTLKSVVQGHSTVAAISASRQKIANVQPYMLNFLENHDEQRIAWKEFAGNPRAGLAMTAISALSDNIPFMMYFGQELGEVSPDVTGFGGADGRTTIFDFWTYPLYQAWRNDGKFDGKGLTEDQKQLRKEYVNLMKVAQEREFIEGKFVDISMSNPSSDQRVYAFARVIDTFFGKKAAIVVANLSGENIETSYELPIVKEEKLTVTLEPYEVIIIK